jgi:nicotinamidase-related amidase
MLGRDSSVLLVVDIQERLAPAIHGVDALIPAVGRLIQAARLLGVPIVATEQYPSGLGPTCAPIRQAWCDVRPFEKVRFSACVEPVLEALAALDRPHILVVGIEAHVCVQQSVLDLLRRGYTPYVCADAVSARRELDREIALQRMRDAGAIVTTVESIIFELLGQADSEEFKRVLKIVK